MDVWKVLFHCPTRQTTKFREYVLVGTHPSRIWCRWSYGW
uniref:Uncharacterized protein n=1 Tax=Anguilla anguilla TaxID=7936 RepID=A0A0E9RZR8_ANGAN